MSYSESRKNKTNALSLSWFFHFDYFLELLVTEFRTQTILLGGLHQWKPLKSGFWRGFMSLNTAQFCYLSINVNVAFKENMAR